MTKEQNISNTERKETIKDMLYRKCFVIVLDIIQYTELLEKNNKYSIAKQLLKSGISLGKHMNDLKNISNESITVKKINTVVKNAQKTKYWLQLCKYSNSYPKPNNLITDIEELLNNFTKFKF